MNNKIGVGLITCNKPDRIALSAPTIPNVDCLVVVNDGSPYSSDLYPKNAEIIQHSKNMSVGVSKNDAMRYLIQQGCDHIFIMEDDVLIKKPDVFEAYIKAAQASGIWHLNYALQGPANRKQIQMGGMDITKRGELLQTSEPNPKVKVDYDGNELAFYPNSVGAFSYYLKTVIKAVGYHDEQFYNAWEHVEHTYRVIKAGLHPPFWWFADLANASEYLDDIPGCIEQSTIAHTPEWIQNFQKGMAYFKYKHNYIPQEIPQTPPDQVLPILEQIKANYARKII
jgi:GT2 family glycosyltransferase